MSRLPGRADLRALLRRVPWIGRLRRRANLLRMARSAEARWSSQLRSETRFWNRWLASRGLDWPEDYETRMCPDRELQEYVGTQLPPSGERGPARVLDVGSGPLTFLGRVWEGKPIDLVAVDPLADRFRTMMARMGATPPVRAVPGRAERLTDVFETDSFDVVHARNAIDHVADPHRAVGEMIAVTRPGGVVILRHMSEEGEHRAYSALHQWNFSLEGEDCVVWNPWVRWSMREAYGNRVDVAAWVEEGWVCVNLRKRRGAPGF